jgi:alkylhydroperoxidase family enzyme
MTGLTNADVLASRRGTATDSKAAAALEFARAVVGARGDVTDADMRGVREAGYSDAEVTEIVANVALNVFTNYFNLVARTETDF